MCLCFFNLMIIMGGGEEFATGITVDRTTKKYVVHSNL